MNSACLLLAAVLLAPQAGWPAAGPTKPNVIVMIADDLGYADVSCLSTSAVKTPHLDRIAQTGVRFTSGYVTAPLCGPSRAGFLTGCYQQRFGFVSNQGGIPAGQPLLPGVLRDAGYHTGLLGKWHSAGPMPHERGCFDETLCSHLSSPFIDYHYPKLARNGKVEVSDEYSTDLFAREAEAFIERNKANPFSLTVAFNAPHILRVVKDAMDIRKEYDLALAAGKTLDVPKVPMARPGEAARYAGRFPGDAARADTVAAIAALDEAVGRILDKLKQTGLDRKTIVFFFADNGAHPENRSENLPLRDHKWSVFEGGIRVPFLACYPGVFPAGIEFSSPVSTLDILPTVAALAGLTPPAHLDGVDLTAHLCGSNTAPPHDALFFSMGGVGAVRQGPWKLHMPRDGIPQLFDLSKDIGERNDIAASEANRVAELKQKWMTWNAQMPAVGGGNKPAAVRSSGEAGKSRPGLAGATGEHAPAQAGAGVAAVGTLKPGDTLTGAAAPHIAKRPFTISCVVQTDQKDAILVAQGGPAVGYVLHVRDGRVCFAVRSARDKLAEISSGELKGPTRIIASLSPEGVMALKVGDQPVVTGEAGGLISHQPVEDFCVGHDSKDPVTTYASTAPFRGKLVSLAVSTK